MREPGSGTEADNPEAFDQMDVDKAKAASETADDDSGVDAPEPSLQQHHNAETEADTASGGPAEE